MLADGTKVTISDQQTTQEAVLEKCRWMQQQAEISKTKRRQDILNRIAAPSDAPINTESWSHGTPHRPLTAQNVKDISPEPAHILSEVAQLRDQCNS